nr:MAG TPA: hypothetical protein [Caudoviricetes sp.]
MRVYMIMPICFCSVMDTWAYLPVGIMISGVLKQHVDCASSMRCLEKTDMLKISDTYY